MEPVLTTISNAPAHAVILVVEDELLIRMDIVEQLEMLGFRLLEAGSGEEALDTIAHAERVDLVFTDVDMPGDVDGLALARELAAHWPAIRLIVTSGHARLRPEILPEGCRYFPKPYRLETVQAAVDDLLA